MSHTLGTHTVVLEYLEVLLIVFLFFLFRICRFAEKNDLKNPMIMMKWNLCFNRLTGLRADALYKSNDLFSDLQYSVDGNNFSFVR